MKALALTAPRKRRAGGAAHERQANHVAARFARGEKRLARYITPAPAAGFTLPQSPGIPLATGLRGELEQAFGADLGAVRVHSDVHAAAAARAAGAHAFASGAHIYFGEGMYRADSPSGRRLLAHEVTHALQQTTRAGPGGLVRAVDRQGAGEVQRWASPLDSTVAVPEIPELLGEHRDALDASAPERAPIERLLRGYRAAGTAGQSAYVEARGTHVRNDSVDPVLGERPSALAAPVASALYDLLKRAYLWGPAARLLHMRSDLQTRFFSAETYQQYMDDHAADFSVAKSRFYRHWYSGAWFGRANPRFMLDRTLVLLIGPTASLTEQSVASGEGLTTAYRAEPERVNSAEMLPDELYFISVQMAGQVELLRYALLDRVRGQVRGFEGYRASRLADIKLTMAQQIRAQVRGIRGTRAQILPASEGANRWTYSRESLLVWLDDVVPALDDIAQYAIAFWQGAEPFETSLTRGAPIEGMTQTAAEALRALDTEIPGYRAMLDAYLHALLDREPDGSLPAPAAFARRRDAAVGRLDSEMFRVVERPLADRMMDALPSQRAQGAFSFDRATADRRVPAATRAMFAWALATAVDFRELGLGYSRAQDEAMVARQRSVDPAAPAADLRHLLRWRVAGKMAHIGRVADWPAWIDWARPILWATELINGQPMTEDYVALGTDWQRDANAAISLMVQDLPAMPHGFEPMSTRDMVEFYLAADYRNMSDHIDRLLQTRSGQYGIRDVPVLNEALAAARNEERPRRDVIRDFRHVHPWEVVNGALRPAPRQEVRELLSAHPLTRARIAQERQHYTVFAWAVAKTQIAGADAAVLWTMPSPLELMERIQAIPAVNQALLAALRGLLLDPGVDPARLRAIDQLRPVIETGQGFRPPADPAQPAPAPTRLELLTVDLLQALDISPWWQLWQAVLAAYPPQERARVAAGMRSAVVRARLPEELVQEREAAYTLYELDERRAIAHERRRVVEVQLRPALQNFERRSFDRYQVPGGRRVIKRLLAGEVATLLRRFVLQLPDEEREAHQAMALLEMSDVISAKLGGLRQVNEFYVWGPLIDEALVWANDAERGADAAVRDSFTVEGEQGDSALFEARRARLLATLTHMAAVLQEHYEQWGLVGRAGDGTIENPGSVHAIDEEQERVGRGTVFVNEGVTYEIIQVHTSFTFHPGAAHFRSLPPRATGGTRLKIADGEFLAEGQRPHTLLMHVLIDGGPEPTAIHADDDPALLSRITWALHMHAILQSLGRLAVAIETFAEVLMDLAELFPVAGQALAAARLVTAAMQFIGSDLPDMAEHLIRNPRALINQVWGRMQGLLSLGNLLEYLVFSNHSLNGLIREPRASGERNPGGTSSRRMRRLVHKLQTFARGVGRVLVRMQDGVQDRRQQVEHHVQGSPRIIRLIQLIADYYFLLARISDYLSQMGDRDEAVREFRAAGQNFPGYLNGLVESIGQIELPEEILPLNELVDILIDVIGHRLGGKYRLGIRILLALLDAVGARAEVVGGLVAVLRGAGVTTDNVFPAWRSNVVPGIERSLQNAQTQFRDTLNGAFAAFGVPLNLEAPRPNVQLSGTEFPDAPPDLPAGAPEAQPLLEEEVRSGLQRRAGGAGLDEARVAELLRALPAEGGEPLPARARARAESRFGQDFSHVRLHRGGRAAELAQSIGARALTSGSHIVMGNAAREGDSRLLYHELAHVVQQTGPRAAGRPRRPHAGRPGRGLRFDPVAEARADAAAAAALRGNARGADPGAAVEGWQPSMIEFLGQRFLRQITDIGAIEAEVAQIDVTGAGTGTRLIGRDVRRAVAGVAANLRAKFRPGANGLWTARNGPFHAKLNAISSHLLNYRVDIEGAIEDIAIRASYQAERARGGRPARMALDVRDFKRRLERYIFGKTGILLELEANTRGRGRGMTFRNPGTPFNKAEVKFVFLAPIHGNAPLWLDALQYRSYHNRPKVLIPQAERAGWRTQIRAVLRSLGPSSSIWIRDEYRLSAAVFEAADELTRLQQTGALAGTLPPDALPSTTEYVNTTSGSATPPHGNQRLHLGTYEQKRTGEQRGKERESHHLTQYLVMEYFHNGAGGARETDSERMGFPLLHDHPDAYGADLRRTSARRPERFRDARIAELEAGRGGKMPTILLARGTHRRGNLHISPRADDFDDTTTATQAGAVNHLYKNELPPAQRRIEREVAQGVQPYSAWEAHVAANPGFGNAIYDAMQATYAHIRGYMQKQLKTALAGIERDYYNDVYVAAHPQASNPQPLTRAAVNRVAQLAEAHNRDGDSARSIHGLRHYGWRA